MSSLDEACAQLVAVAEANGLEGIQVDVHADGRVYLYGRKRAYPHYTAWTALADVTPGGAFDSPGVVLDRMRGDK